MPRNNWTPVVLDLLYLLTEEGGAVLHSADNGDGFRMLNGSDITQLRKDFAEELASVDESRLRITMQFQQATLFLVFGNEPAELVADWGAPEGTAIYWMLEAITRKFSDQWEGKPCPVIEDEEPEPISEKAYRAAAERIHADEGTLEIDDDAKISKSDDPESNGAYVAAWVWVYDDDITAEDRA
jgi:hypothetical protein